MQDYHQILTEVQRHLAQQYFRDQNALNQPGVSTACKIDPFHYLVLEPSFFLSLAKWSGYRPLLIQETLLRTGNLLRLAGQDDFAVDLSVTWSPDMQPLRIKAGFVLADFIDSGLRIYAQQKDLLPVSELKILDSERQRLQKLFQDKTPLNNLAFT
ncbi:MAG: hypothetical protein ACLFRL_06195 [Desulfohalobiaceae bacterium]